MIRKTRTTLIALAAAFSFAATMAPTAEAMPRDCTKLEAAYDKYMDYHRQAWGMFVATGHLAHRDAAHYWIDTASRVYYQAKNKGCYR